MKIHRISVWLLVPALLATAAPVQATPITFAYSQGSLSGSATFDTVGGDLIVRLANTASADVLVPSEVLTAVFFDIQGASLTLTPVSGSIRCEGSTSAVVFRVASHDGTNGRSWSSNLVSRLPATGVPSSGLRSTR